MILNRKPHTEPNWTSNVLYWWTFTLSVQMWRDGGRVQYIVMTTLLRCIRVECEHFMYIFCLECFIDVERIKIVPWSSRWFEEISVALIWVTQIWLALIWVTLIWLTLIWLTLVWVRFLSKFLLFLLNIHNLGTPFSTHPNETDLTKWN